MKLAKYDPELNTFTIVRDTDYGSLRELKADRLSLDPDTTYALVTLHHTGIRLKEEISTKLTVEGK